MWLGSPVVASPKKKSDFNMVLSRSVDKCNEQEKS